MLENRLCFNLSTVISYVIDLWICKKIFNYSNKKKYINISLNLIILLTVILILFMPQIYIKHNNLIIMGVISTSIIYIYSNNITTAILLTLVYWLVLLKVDELSMSIAIKIHSLDSIDMLLFNDSYRLQSIVLGKIILIVLLFIYKLIRFECNLQKNDILYLKIPILSSVLLFFIVFKYIFEFLELNLISRNDIIYILIILFISSLSTVLVIRKIKSDSILLSQKEMVQNNLKMQYNYYMTIKENQDKIRQLHHDMKNHIICMRKLHENGYVDERYTDSLDRKIKSYENKFDTGNILLDIILMEKKQICDEKNIKFLSSINFTKCDFMALEDVCSIFSNILDNSIEACSKINNDDKFIFLEGKVVKKFFVIKVENSKVNKINIKNNKFITDKENKISHGLGISSIKNSVKKYDGETVIYYTDDRFIIKILIPIPLYKE